MTEQLKLKLNDSKATRWGALVIVAFTMMAAYYVNDVVAPLKTMLETDLAWSSTDFGFFTGGYSFLNVFFLMLIWGGLILDRFGIRFTGKLATILMVGGTALEYYAMTGLAGADATLFGINEIFGYKTGVFVAFAGYSIFGVGAEVAGITVSKIIAKWFKGKELATAMGVQVALARIGSQAGYAVAIPLARAFGISTPVLLGLVLLLGGMIAFFIFAVMDKKLDKQMEAAAIAAGTEDEEEKFSFKDVKNILVEHCVLWNAEPGNAVEIGYEVRCDEISDITFRDLDIVHCEYEGNQSGGVLTIHNADRAHIHDIVYEDIRVEDAQEKFVDIKVLDSKYSLDRKRGSVENIYFRNVEILNGHFPVSIIRGFEMHTEMSRPRNIYFDNVVVLGKQVESPSDLHMVVELSDDILFNGTTHAKRNPF